MTLSPQDRQRMNLRAGQASVAVATVLVTAKAWAFAVTGSLAVAASLADSALDLMVSLTALLAIRYAARPPDADHAWGHSSAEDLAALGQSVVIVGSAVLIAWTAAQRLWFGTSTVPREEGAGLAIMGLSMALTAALVLYQRRVARLTGNKIVEADSLHYLGDLIPNVGAVAALGAAAAFGILWVDSVIALLAAALMAGGAVNIGRRAVDALMDRAAPKAVEDGLADIVRAHAGVRGFHDLRTRMAGSTLFVTVHIELDAGQTLYDAHEIGAALRRRIMDAYPQADVTIHKDVWFPE